MATSPRLIQLLQWLAGEFDNQAQSLAQPAWFVHLRLWHRPLPILIDGQLALFAEQANALYLNRPYRQRLIVFQQTSDHSLCANYWAFQHPEQFCGAGVDPSRLQNLSLHQVERLPGCSLAIQDRTTHFIAQMATDAKCCFQYQGETRQVVLGFEVSANQFLSYDRGVDPNTGQSLWGALMGPYHFQKCQNYASELPLLVT